jgi:hypothetical protein
VNVLIGGTELEIVETFPENVSFEGAAIHQLYLPPLDDFNPVLNRAQVYEEAGDGRLVESARRHAAARYAVAYERDQALIVTMGKAAQNRWAHLASITIAAMAARADSVERAPARVGRLRE